MLDLLAAILALLDDLLSWIMGRVLDLFFLAVAASVTAMVAAFSYNFVMDMIK